MNPILAVQRNNDIPDDPVHGVRNRQRGASAEPPSIDERRTGHDTFEHRPPLSAGGASIGAETDLPPVPDLLASSHRELRNWATMLYVEDAEALIADMHARSAAHLKALERGEQPPVAEMIGTARALNVLVWEQSRRVWEDIPLRGLRDYATLFDVGRDMAARLPEARQLHAAASTVFDVAGSLPRHAPGDLPTRWKNSGDELNFLHTLPQHIGRMAHYMERAVAQIPWSAEEAYRTRDRTPRVEHIGRTASALAQISGLSHHLEEIRRSDGTDWSEYIDGYLVAGLETEFDPNLIRALRSLPSDAMAFEQAQTGSDGAFAAAAAAYLPALTMVAEHYLTRSRNGSYAFDLLCRVEEAFRATSARLGDSESALGAARTIGLLYDDIAEIRDEREDYEVIIACNHALAHFQNPAFAESIDQLLRELHSIAAGSGGPRSETPPTPGDGLSNPPDGKTESPPRPRQRTPWSSDHVPPPSDVGKASIEQATSGDPESAVTATTLGATPWGRLRQKASEVGVAHDQPASELDDRAPDDHRILEPEDVNAPEQEHQWNGVSPPASPSSRARPSDAALEAWHRYLDAAEAADGRAQELLAEAEQHTPDAAERAYTRRFAENERRMGALAAELGVPLDRLRALMVEELRQVFDGEIVTRTKAGSLRAILETGRFKTEFDFVGKRGIGQALLADRALLEQALFGYPPDLPVESRPIYGFIRTAPSYRVTAGDALAQYGDIDIVFKTTVEERTTANVGDTKSVAAIPSKVTDPRPESFAATPPGHRTLGYLGLEGIDRDYAGDRFTSNSYIEAQVHGATVADIDYVVFHASAPDQRLQELLDQAGIPWSHFFRHPSVPSRTSRASELSRAAEPDARASEPETPDRSPRPARPAAPIGTMGVPDPEEPIDGIGRAWDHGRTPGPRHKRVERLGELNATGGGWPRGGGRSEPLDALRTGARGSKSGDRAEGDGRAQAPRDLSALSTEAHAALDTADAELRDLGSADQIAEQLMRDGLPGQTAVVLERIDGVDRARTLVYDGRRVVEVRDPNTDDGMIHEFVPGSSAAEQTRALVYSPVEAADRLEAEQALGRLLGRHDSDRFPEHFPDGIPDRPTRAATALDFDRPRTIDGPLRENEWSTLAKLYPNEVSGSRGAPESARAKAREVWSDRYFPREPVPASETPAQYLARHADVAIATYSNTYRAGANDGIHGWVDQEGVLLFQIGAAEGTPSGQQMFRDLMAEIGSYVRAIRAPWSVGDSFSDNIDTFNAYRQDLGLSPEDAARRTFTGKMADGMGFTEVTVNHLIGPVGEHLIVDVTFSKPTHSPMSTDQPGGVSAQQQTDAISEPEATTADAAASATVREAGIRRKYDAVPMPSHMYMYTPEVAASLDYTNVYTATGGGIHDEDAPYTTGPEGDVFFLTANGARSMPAPPGTHALLYSSFSEPDIHVYSFGHWFIDGGRNVYIIFGSKMLPKASADLKYVAQGLFEMADRGVPVDFDDTILGDLWRKQIPVGVPTAGQLIDQRGESPHPAVPDARTMFPGATAQFWMYVTAVVAEDDSLSIVFSINPVLGKPGRITLVLTRENGVITARYADIALGEDADRVTAAIDEFHTRVADPWLTRSGVIFTGSDAPVDSATDDPGAHLQELRIRLESARADLAEVLGVLTDLVRAGWVRQAVTIAQRWIRGLGEAGWAAVASAQDMDLLVDWVALRLPVLRDIEAANAAQADPVTQQQLTDSGEELDRQLANLLGLSEPGPTVHTSTDNPLMELRALADATNNPDLQRLVDATENFLFADRAVARLENEMRAGSERRRGQAEATRAPDDAAPEPALSATGVADSDSSPQSPLYGWDDNGHYIEFEIDDVWIIPVSSSDGKISGAGFPGDEQNADEIRAWGLTDNRPGNREFIPVWPVSDVATRMPDIAPTSQWADDPQPEEAPYFDAEKNREPIVVFAHAEENGYLIKVEDRQNGQRRGVLVDGIVFGRIVWSSAYFRTASAQHPGSQLLLVGCSAAAGDAHRLLSNYLHEQGFTGDVWGGRDIMLTSDEGHVCIRIEVAPDGTMVPPFDVTRAPGSPQEGASAESPPGQAAQQEVRPPSQVTEPSTTPGGLPSNPLPPGVELFHHVDPNPIDAHFPHRPHGIGVNKQRNLNQHLLEFHHHGNGDDRFWDKPHPENAQQQLDEGNPRYDHTSPNPGDGEALLAVKAAAKAALDAAHNGDERELKRLRRTIRQLGNPAYEQYLELRFLQGLTVADATAAISANRTADADKSLRRRAVHALAAVLPVSPAELLDSLDAAAPNATLVELVDRLRWQTALTERLRAAILSGRLAEGRLLPVDDALAEHLGLLSRDVVDSAYRQLAGEGYVVVHRGVGTKVASRDQWPDTPPSPVASPITPEEMLEVFTEEASIRELLQAAGGNLKVMVLSALRRAVLSDRFADRMLPRAEQLGAALHMSRGPVEKAYRQLSVEGYVVITPGSGTTVKSRNRWPTPPPATPPRGHGLSDLDVEVLELAAAGLSVGEIAEAAGVSRSKVNYSFERIRVKLRISGDRAEIVAVAKQRRIIGDHDRRESIPHAGDVSPAVSPQPPGVQAIFVDKTGEALPAAVPPAEAAKDRAVAETTVEDGGRHFNPHADPAAAAGLAPERFQRPTSRRQPGIISPNAHLAFHRNPETGREWDEHEPRPETRRTAPHAEAPPAADVDNVAAGTRPTLDKSALPKVKAAFEAALVAADEGDDTKLEQLRAALGRVRNEDQRMVLGLRYLQHLTFAQIGDETGGFRSENAIKHLHHRGVQALAKILDEEADPETKRLTPAEVVEVFSVTWTTEQPAPSGARGWRNTVVAKLRQAILSGRLAEGRTLPPASDLAAQLGASSASAVAAAYQQLAAEGYLVSRRKAGTRITSRDKWPVHTAAVPEADSMDAGVTDTGSLRYVVPDDVVTAEVAGSEHSSALNLRRCIDQALKALDRIGVAITPGPDGEPQLSDDLVVATVQTKHFTGVALGEARTLRAIGLDAKRHAALRSDLMLRMTQREERSRMRDLMHTLPAVHWDQVHISAKENVLGLHAKLTGHQLRHNQVEVTFHPDAGDGTAGTFEAQLPADGPAVVGTIYQGRFRIQDGTIVTGVTLRNGGDASEQAHGPDDSGQPASPDMVVRLPEAEPHADGDGAARGHRTDPATTEPMPTDSKQVTSTGDREAGSDTVTTLDLVSVTSTQLIELLASGRITSVQLTRLCLHRIEKLSVLRAVIGINPRALEEAARADELRRAGAAHGPLLGVPVLIKGSIDIAGMPTTAGSVALANSYPATDAALVTRLRKAGAVILGHSNLTEFGSSLSSTLPYGYSSYGGQTLNPIDVSLVPGGSSSGSAVGVAAGLVPLAVGSQASGSITTPANWNSIVGLKPTVGAVPRVGAVPMSTTRDSPGAHSPDVTGAAILLTALVGVDPRDPATAHNPLAGHDFTADLNPEALRGARIGVLTLGVEPEGTPKRRLWDAALSTLKARGATLITLDLDNSHSFQDDNPPCSSVFSYEMKRDLNTYLSQLPADAPMKDLADIIAYNNANAEIALKYGQDLLIAAQAKDLGADSADTAKYQADLQLDLAESKTRIDAVMAEHELTALLSVYEYGTIMGDKAGYPCIIVPAGRTPATSDHPAGEHVNVTFRAAAWSEPTLIGYAYAFEQAHAVQRPRPQFADQLYRQATAENAETAVSTETVTDSGDRQRSATVDGETDAAREPAPSDGTASPTRRSAVPPRVGLIGGVPDLVDPFDDHGDPWDRGGPVPRHQRINRLVEPHADGGGFAPGRERGEPATSEPAAPPETSEGPGWRPLRMGVEVELGRRLYRPKRSSPTRGGDPEVLFRAVGELMQDATPTAVSEARGVIAHGAAGARPEDRHLVEDDFTPQPNAPARERAADPSGFGMDIPERKARDIGIVPPPRGQRFDPGMVHATDPNVGPDGHAFGRPGRRAEPPAHSEDPVVAEPRSGPDAAGNTGQSDGRESYHPGTIRMGPAGLIVPADPADSLIVPAAYVIPADPSLEELMERLRPWKEIFSYFWEFPMPREGELSGRQWIESNERRAWMRRRAILRTPLYAGVDAAVRLTLGAERLLAAPNASPGPATLRQRRVIPGRGETDAEKKRTLRADAQVRESNRADTVEMTAFERFWRGVSGDEIPQTKQIRRGEMAYVGGRLLRAEGHNLMVAGRYAEDYELMVTGRDPVLTPEEYALWLMFSHDALWTVHYPGCRELEPQSPEFLLTRYLTVAIFDKIASKPLEVQYLNEVVRPYLRRQGAAAGRVLLHELSHHLLDSSRSTLKQFGMRVGKGLGGKAGDEGEQHLDNCAACRNSAATPPAANSLDNRELVDKPLHATESAQTVTTGIDDSGEADPAGQPMPTYVQIRDLADRLLRQTAALSGESTSTETGPAEPLLVIAEPDESVYVVTELDEPSPTTAPENPGPARRGDREPHDASGPQQSPSTSTSATDEQPHTEEPSAEVAQRISSLTTRLTELILMTVQRSREGKPVSADRVNRAHDQIAAELARLRSTGTVIDDVPVVAGPDRRLALDSVFEPEIAYQHTFDYAMSILLGYPAARVKLAPDETRDQLAEIRRAIDHVAELAAATGRGAEVEEIEILVTIFEWMEQAAAGGRPLSLEEAQAGPQDRAVPSRTTARQIPDVTDNADTAPENTPAASSQPDRQDDPVEIRRDRSDRFGHEAALPDDAVRAVAEPEETADLGLTSKLYAATMPDGRTVHFRFLGNPYGYPILLSPGTPVGVDGPLPDPWALYNRGFAVVVVERPGYGDSDPLPGRTVADCARDIIHIATELFAFNRYSVLGRSGGGSVAIAVGALDPEHVDRVVSLVGTAPRLDDMGGWMAGMAEENQRIYARPDIEAMAATLTDMADHIAQDGEWLLRYNQDAFTLVDHMWVGTHRKELARGYQRAVRNYRRAWADDAIQLTGSWGIRFDRYRVPVDLVHGAADQFSPVDHSRDNARLIPTSKLYLFRGVSHMMGMDALPVIASHFRAERDAFYSARRDDRHIQAIQRAESDPLPFPRWIHWTRGRWDSVPDYADDGPVLDLPPRRARGLDGLGFDPPETVADPVRRLPRGVPPGVVAHAAAPNGGDNSAFKGTAHTPSPQVDNSDDSRRDAAAQRPQGLSDSSAGSGNLPARPLDPREVQYGLRTTRRAQAFRPDTGALFDPAVALDLPPRRARGLDGFALDPPSAVADPFGGVRRGLPDGVLAHAGHPHDPDGGAFGAGRSEAERIANAALSTFRAEATFENLQNWAARLSDGNLDHLLVGFTSRVTGQIAAIHHGEPPSVTDNVINPARLLSALVAEATRRFGDSVPPTAPTTYGELFALGPWLQAKRRTIGALEDAMTAVLDAAYAVARTVAEHRWSVDASHHTIPSHLAEAGLRIEEAGRHDIWLEEDSFQPSAAPTEEHARLAESFVRSVEHGRTMARMVTEWAGLMNGVLRLQSGKTFSPRYATIFQSLPVHAVALERARTGSDRLFAATAATALPHLLDAAFYLFPTSNSALGLDYLRQVDDLLTEAIARFGNRAVIYSLQEAADGIRRLYEDITVACSRRSPEVRSRRIHETLSEYFDIGSEPALAHWFHWGVRALWGLGSQSPGIEYAPREHPLDRDLPWDWDTTDDERALAATAVDLLQILHGRGAGIRSLLEHGDTADLFQTAFDTVSKNMRWWIKLRTWTSGNTPIGSLLAGATDFSVSQIQLAVLRQYPHIIGAAAGIPYRARDLANRLSLARDLESPRVAPERRRELAALREQLAEVRNMVWRLPVDASPPPPVLLVSYDPVTQGGTGRAVVSIGEADHASFVAFNVTAADTPVTDLSHWADHACLQYEVAQQHAPRNNRISIMFTVGLPRGFEAPSHSAGPDPTARGNVVEARDVAGDILARELMIYDATREMALDSRDESWSRMVRLSTVVGHGDGIGVLRSSAETLALSSAVDQIVLVPGSADDRLLTASQLHTGTERVYTLNPHRDRNGDPNTIGLIVVGHGAEIESAPEAAGRSTAPLIETPTTVRDLTQLLSAHDYRPLEGSRGYVMTHDEGLTVYRAAQPLLHDALTGTYNTTVVLEDLGLVLRIGQPDTGSYDPRFGPEHRTLPVISRYVRNAPQLLKVITGHMPDGRVIDGSAPILIERLARGQNLAETFRRADRRAIRSHQGLILRTFANIHEQLRTIPENHPLLDQLTPPGVAKGDTGGWYLNHINWYLENFYRRHLDRFGHLFDEFGLLRGNPFEPLIDDARSMRESRHHILHADPNEGNFLISNELRVTLLDWELAVNGPSAYDWARLGHLIPGIEVPRELGGPDMVKFARVEKFKRVMNDTVKLAPLAAAGQLTPQLIEFIETEFSEAVIQVRQLSGHTDLLPPRAELEILRSWRP
ncbi:alpha/beta fold hydrolase [Nocardia niwae]|uniref:alpha/beta fold hydrolase n=1 Tax=Nocardia niwae TaxID=626084 RepID=UPI0007A45168|nr:alpha/beta fold hydrolase [Nocardia niwae]